MPVVRNSTAEKVRTSPYTRSVSGAAQPSEETPAETNPAQRRTPQSRLDGTTTMDGDMNTTMISSEISNSSNSKAVEIAKDGDIILVVGPEKLQLRCHSYMLKAAGGRMWVLLEPNIEVSIKWETEKEESASVTAVQSTKVYLPEDDAEAMTYICRVIHLQSDQVTLAMDSERVLQFAKFVDKYSIQPAVHAITAHWFKMSDHMLVDWSNWSCAMTGRMMVAADLTNHPDAYTFFANQLIHHYQGDYIFLQGTSEADVLSTIYFLERRRNQWLYLLSKKLTPFCFCGQEHNNTSTLPCAIQNCDCGFQKRWVDACRARWEQLAGQKNYFERSVSSVKFNIEHFFRIARDFERKSPQCPAQHPKTAADGHSYIRKGIENINNVLPDPCLYCMRKTGDTKHTKDQICSNKIGS